MKPGTRKFSPSLTARTAGGFYVLTTALGVGAYMTGGKAGDIENLIATACYIVVTVLFYTIFRPVNRPVSLAAVLFSFAGCGLQILDFFQIASVHVNNIIFFGCYCLLIAILVFRSTFLPRILGAFMVLAGLSWLTYLSPRLGQQLSSYTFICGLVGEGALTLWLLIKGVDVERWKQQAGSV